jgi:hypothetical protein
VVLASDGEREQAAASLREHFVRGRLTLDELSERTEMVLRARSREELRHACAGLPRLTRQMIATVVVRGAALVLFTGVWLVFSFVLLIALGLTLLIHGATLSELVGFVVVWLVPTYLLSRLWRGRPLRHVG